MVASAQLPLNFAFFCIFSRIICDVNAATLCIINTNTHNTSLIPRPSRGGEKKAWCILFAHACN